MARGRRGRGERIALTGTSALLLAASLQREALAWIAPFALVPWLVALARSRALAAGASALLLGVGYGVLAAPWIPEALRTLGSSPAAARTGLLLAGVWAGPPVFVVAAGLERLAARRSAALRALVLGCGVFAAETLLAKGWWGVPWGRLGHSQRAALGVAQLAAVGGVPLVSALLVAQNVALADALSRRLGAARVAAALTGAWATLALAGLPLAEALRPSEGGGAPVHLLLVQPALAHGERWRAELQARNLARVADFSRRALAAAPGAVDALVWPENLLTAPGDRRLADALAARVDELGRPVLTGLALPAPSGDASLYRSAAVWLEPGRGITARVDKVRAIPLVESSRRFPGDAWLASAVGAAARWKKVEEDAAGRRLGGPIPLAVALCYEAHFPDLVARRRTPESVGIAILADEGWVRDSRARRTLAGFARFRAIEQRLPLVRVAQGGRSQWIDPFGRVVATLPADAWASLRVTLPSAPPPRWREQAALAALALLSGALVGGIVTIASPSRRSPRHDRHPRGEGFPRRRRGAGRGVLRRPDRARAAELPDQRLPHAEALPRGAGPDQGRGRRLPSRAGRPR